MAPTHLVHSHAQEGDIPGTVNLQAAEGDDTGTSRDGFWVAHFTDTDIFVLVSFWTGMDSCVLCYWSIVLTLSLGIVSCTC
jgi:hypothetical protein